MGHDVPNNTVLCLPDLAVPPEFGNIGVNVPGGLPYQPWAAALVKSRQANFGKDDPTTHCLPGASPSCTLLALLRKIVHSAGTAGVLQRAPTRPTVRSSSTDARLCREGPGAELERLLQWPLGG